MSSTTSHKKRIRHLSLSLSWLGMDPEELHGVYLCLIFMYCSIARLPILMATAISKITRQLSSISPFVQPFLRLFYLLVLCLLGPEIDCVCFLAGFHALQIKHPFESKETFDAPFKSLLPLILPFLEFAYFFFFFSHLYALRALVLSTFLPHPFLATYPILCYTGQSK